MIEQLVISNFKSIKHLDIPCKKLNIFIGEPNSGKSNIIEALALQCPVSLSHNVLNKDIFRYKTMGDLYYDFNINEPIVVNTGEQITTINYGIRNDGGIENNFKLISNARINTERPYTLEHDGKIQTHGDSKSNVRFYEFRNLTAFFSSYLSYLSMPFGENLPNLLLANVDLKKWVSEFVQSKGLKLTLKPTENDINLSKLVEDEIYSYPYFSTSETLQRIIFYNIAIKSNKDAVLLFDEPESNTFPFYTKFLGERIALDESNQFFITTHNPYLLLSLIEKTSFENLNVCLVEMKEYQTKVTVLNEQQISTVLDLNSDVFFNFNQISEA